MALLNYESLVAEIIKPLVTHPEDVETSSIVDGDKIVVKALVNCEDLGRVIGKKGRVASAIRTIAYAAAIRQKQSLDIEFDAKEN